MNTVSQGKPITRRSFTLGPLEGIIEWETQRDRIDIGIWQSDLH